MYHKSSLVHTWSLPCQGTPYFFKGSLVAVVLGWPWFPCLPSIRALLWAARMKPQRSRPRAANPKLHRELRVQRKKGGPKEVRAFRLSLGFPVGRKDVRI